jgi:hypothetical protein
MQALTHVIPVKSNIEFAVGYFSGSDLLINLFNDPVRKEYTPWLYADNRQVIETQMVFEELMTQPLYGYV